MLEKLEKKYGLIMYRKDVMTEMKISLSTVRRMETTGRLVRLPNQGVNVVFSTEVVANMMEGKNND